VVAVSGPGRVTPGRAAPPRPAALAYGVGHVIVHANAAFIDEFGADCVGLPAAEALLDLPPAAFALLDLVYHEGRPRAIRIDVRGEPRRLVVVSRRDVETGEVYGLAVHLVAGQGPAADRPSGATGARPGAAR